MPTDRRKLRDLTTISEISIKLTSELELNSLFNLIVFYATVLTEADKAMLWIIDPETSRHKAMIAYGYTDEDEIVGQSSAVSPNTDALLNENVPFLLVRANERKTMPFLKPDDPWEAIVVPLPGKREVIGTLIVEDKLSNDPFSTYDGTILHLLAAQAGISIENARLYQELDRLVELRTKALEAERNKSEKLLLSILPEEISLELKVRGRVTPRRYDSVSILFTDFVGFTNYSENIQPEELLDDLEACYALFDEIVESHNLEKLKTIGDSYMCAGGLPVQNSTHAVDCVAAGLEMVESINKMKKAREALGIGFWDVRVGIHTGPVVSGVIGRKKITYDVWGDTVNLANRMESNGIPNQVNISEATYSKVQHCFNCKPRGLIDVKGHGKVPMYLVRGMKASENRS